MCLPKDVETQKKHLMLSVFPAEINGAQNVIRLKYTRISSILLSLFVFFMDSIGP